MCSVSRVLLADSSTAARRGAVDPFKGLLLDCFSSVGMTEDTLSRMNLLVA
jgi:hypothetical protein